MNQSTESERGREAGAGGHKIKNETYQLETYVEGDGEEHEREKKL